MENLQEEMMINIKSSSCEEEEFRKKLGNWKFWIWKTSITSGQDILNPSATSRSETNF